jgi:hypothetical protein
MNLSIAWVPPVPAPTCGYRALYRAKGASAYTEISTSGTTATVVLTAPACYEGLVKSDYCSGTASGVPFGVNAYGEFTVDVIINDSNEAEITITSAYPSPYDLMVSGTYDLTANLITITETFTDITLTAGDTTYTEVLTAPLSGSHTVSNIVVTAFASVFNEGGQLQQLDPVSTPEYFQFYWDQDGEPVWDGAPITLPSFTLDSFVVTEQDISGTPSAGTLNFSYIVPDGSVQPFNLVELIANDDFGNIGTTIISIENKGVTNGTIDITITGLLSDNRRLRAYWPDTTLIALRDFVLPTVD